MDQTGVLVDADMDFRPASASPAGRDSSGSWLHPVYSLTDQLDAGNVAHVRSLDQGLSPCGIAE